MGNKVKRNRFGVGLKKDDSYCSIGKRGGKCQSFAQLANFVSILLTGGTGYNMGNVRKYYIIPHMTHFLTSWPFLKGGEKKRHTAARHANNLKRGSSEKFGGSRVGSNDR